MGAPKQKWTAEEENTLKAGVFKHGAGKWRTILKDPEFSAILSSRSNVDLKDKWRNMSVVANGWGSREKARISMKQGHYSSSIDDNSLAISIVPDSFDDEIIDAKPLAISSEMHLSTQKRSVARVDNLVLEAIINLKEPSGSNKTAIAMYIEDQCWVPPNFKRILAAKLEAMTTSGKLIKVNRKYRIAPTTESLEGRSSVAFLDGGRHRASLRMIDKDDIRLLSKSQIDAELMRMKNMTPREAAAAAAQAVAEAEAAMLEAEEAAREAEAAEAEAEAAQAAAEAALMTLRARTSAKLMITG